MSPSIRRERIEIQHFHFEKFSKMESPSIRRERIEIFWTGSGEDKKLMSPSIRRERIEIHSVGKQPVQHSAVSLYTEGED